jgi:3-hydroxymyristoyl/3-hydroxydecanoyl-(acyl carrier protein) dehydratase
MFDLAPLKNIVEKRQNGVVSIWTQSPSLLYAVCKLCLSSKWTLRVCPSLIVLQSIQEGVVFCEDFLIEKMWIENVNLATQIQFLTSGSMGEPKVVGRSVLQLNLEVECLESHIGQNIGLNADWVLKQTVPCVHLYGFLFGIWWPQFYGRPIVSKIDFFFEPLFEGVQGHQVFMISSPAHLRLLYSEQVKDLQVDMVICSSGGALDLGIQNRLAEFSHDLFEIYGSTETGGIALAQYSRGPQIWQAFQDTEWKIDEGVLWVKSLRTPTPGSWYSTQDLAEADQDQFKLKGRMDSIVKVSEKRISLKGLETCLSQVEEVLEVKCFLPSRQTDSENDLPNIKRDEIYALIKTDFKNFERKPIIQKLKEVACKRFEASTIPKKWAFVVDFPKNALFKTTQWDLLMHFNKYNIDGLEAFLILKEENKVILEFEVPQNYKRFVGHFDGFPLVAGVCQLHWIYLGIRMFFDTEFPMLKLPNVKFHNFLRPETRVHLTLEKIKEGQYKALIVNAQDLEQKFASGRFSL